MISTIQHILSSLLPIDSISENSNLSIIDFIEDYLDDFGIACARIYSADRRKASLLATIGNAGAPGVVLSAHTDVVPVEGQAWSFPPFAATVRDGRIFGRGSTDMKGFIATVLAHVPEFAAASTGTPVHLAFSYDEEVGCRGAPDLVRAVAGLEALPALAIVGEPTGMRVAHAHKGKVAKRVTVAGRTGHSALPHRAANAVDAAAALAFGLRKIGRRLASSPGDGAFDPPWTSLHVGSLHGGGALNLVPDRAVLEFEIRYMPGEDVTRIFDEVNILIEEERRTLKEAAAEADILVEDLSAYPALDCAPDGPAARTTARLAGDRQPATTISFGTEAGIYAAAGIPTIVCGPGDIARAHKADEWIGIDELAAASRMMNRLADALQRPASEWITR